MAQQRPLDPAAYRRPVYEACVWCGGTDLTNEDVIPNWLRRKFLVLPNSPSDHPDARGSIDTGGSAQEEARLRLEDQGGMSDV